MIKVELKCPHCGKILMDGEHKVDNVPSIALLADYNGKSEMTYLSSYYGSYTVMSPFDVKKGDIVSLSCPHCKHELSSSRRCDECGAPMSLMHLVSGGGVQICSRRGCTRHVIEFEDLDTQLKVFYDAYDL